MSFDFDSFMRVVKPLSPSASPFVQFLETRLTGVIQAADRSVQKVFFAGMPTPPTARESDVFDNELRTLAGTYAAFLLSTVPDLEFGKTIKDGWASVDGWFDKNSNPVGARFLVEYLNQPEVLGTAFHDPGAAAIIAEHAGTEAFLVGLLTEGTVAGESCAAAVLLLALQAMDPSGKHFSTLLAQWKRSPEWPRIEGWDQIRWLDPVRGYFQQESAGYGLLKAPVRTACLKQQVERSERSAGFTQASSGRVSSAKVTVTRTTFGREVVEWLDSESGPRRYGLRAAHEPNNVVVDDGGSGCVLPTTPILMADGTWRPIRELREGDRVFSASGRVSVLSSERVVNRNITQLWSINDDEPFMSLEHAIMTQRGWCCVAPDVARQINPHLAVKTIAVGDVVWKVKPVREGAVTYEMVVVKKVNLRRTVPGERLEGHDLHFREGHDSYHAGGYLNLLNYPEITTQRLASGMMENMSAAERQQFQQQLGAMAPMLTKALGAPVVEAVRAAVLNPELRMRSHGVAARRTGNLAADKVVPKMRATAIQGNPATPLPFDSLSLIDGVLLLDGEPVESHFEDHDIYWTRTRTQGAEHGAIRLSRHGLFGDGVVLRDNHRQTFRVTTTVSFSTSVTDGATQSPWFDFSYGLNAQGVPVGWLVAPDDPKKTERLAKAATIAFGFDEHDILKVTVTFKPTFCRFGGSKFISAEFVFNGDYTAFTGTAVAYDPHNREGNTGKSYPVTGREKTDSAALRQQATHFLHGLPARVGLLDTEAGLAALSPGLKTARTLVGDIANSVEALFNLDAPDQALLHGLTFSKMKSLMLYAIDDKWRGWFGETKPTHGKGETLSDTDLAALKEASIKSFLTDKFAVGYLAQAFSTSDEPKIKEMYAAIPGYDKKLTYFWKGSERNQCFGAYQAYGDLSMRMLSSAYGEQVPGLRRYLDDEPAKWARQLYEHCMRRDTLLGLQVSYAVGSTARLRHLTTILQTLDATPQVEGPDKKKSTYASALYCKVVGSDLMHMALNVTLGSAPADELKAFLIDFLTQYFNSILQDDARWIEEIRNAAKEELNKAGIRSATQLTKDIVGLATDFVELAVLNKDNPISVLLREFISSPKYPKLPVYLGRALMFAGYATGMMLAFMAFSNWKRLNDAQKTSVVTGAISMIAGIFSEIAGGVSGSRTAQAVEAWNKVDEAMNLEIADEEAAGFFESFERSSEESGSFLVLEEEVSSEEELFGEFEIVENRFLSRGGLAAAGAIEEATTLEASAAKWAKLSLVLGKVARAFNVLAMGAAVGASIYQVVQDFAENGPVQDKVLDILQVIAGAIATVMESITTIAEIFASEIADAIPVIGIVAVIIGIILQIIQLILGHSPPPTPEQEFVRDHAIPFIKALKWPPPTWNNPGLKPPGPIIA